MTGDGLTRKAILHPPSRNRFGAHLGWCNACSDGLRSHQKDKAQEWVDRHNKQKHEESNE